MNPFDLIKRNAQGIVDRGKSFLSGQRDPLNPPTAPMSKPFDIRNIPNAPMSRPKQTPNFIPDTTLSKPTTAQGPFGIPLRGGAADLANKEKQMFKKIIDFLPTPLRQSTQQVQRGLVGDQRLMIRGDGQGFYDGGFAQFFRPLGASSLELKSQKANQLLQNLVQEGKITQPIADNVSMDYLNPLSKKDGYSPQVKKALRPLRIEDKIDQTFGALDLVSAGTIKPVGRAAAERIAKSKVVDDIFNILTKEMPDVDEGARRIFATVLRELDNADDVKTVLDNIHFQSRQFKPPTAPKADTAPTRKVAYREAEIEDIAQIIENKKPILIDNFGEAKPFAPDIDMALGQGRNKNQIIFEVSGDNMRFGTAPGGVSVDNLIPDNVTKIYVPKDNTKSMYVLRNGNLSPSMVKRLESLGFDTSKAKTATSVGVTRKADNYIEIPRKQASPVKPTPPRTLPTVAKEISNTNDVPSIIKTITNKTNISPATATRIAPELAQATDAKQVLSMIRGANVDNATALRAEFLEDIVSSSPFSQRGISNKLKNLVNREGQILEQSDLARGSRTSKIFHDVKSETGFLGRHDSEFVDALETYFKQKRELNELKSSLRATPKVESTLLPANKETKALQAISEQTPVKDPQVPFKKGPIKPEGDVTVRMYATGKKVETPLAPDARIRAFPNQSAFDNFVKTLDERAVGKPHLTRDIMLRNNTDVAKVGDEYVVFNPKITKKAFENATPPPNTKQYTITPEDFEDLVFRDIGGVVGGKSFNVRDASLAIDNLDAFEMARKNRFGPTTKAYYNVKYAETEYLEWYSKNERALANVLKGVSKKEMQQIADFRLGINETPLNSKLDNVNKRITQITDKIREDYNAWARSVGLPEIGYVENYLSKKPQLKGPIPTKRTKVSDSFTKERVGGDLPEIQETRLDKLLSTYVRNVGKNMYMQGSLDQFKAVASELRDKHGINKGANFIDKFITDTLNPKVTDSFGEKVGNAIITARSTAALAGNIVWSLFTQPLSFAFSVGRNPRLIPVIKGTIKEAPISRAIYQAFTKDSSTWIKKLPTYRQKVDVPMSVAGLGDISSPGFKVRIGGKREKVNRVLGFIGDKMEETLSRISASIAREYGKSIGMKGDVLDIYSDLMIGLTQSEYLKSARPEAMQSMIARLIAPFQTYAFEAYRFGKTAIGASGGLPIKQKSQRLKQVIGVIAVMMTMDWLQSKATGRKISSVGSNIPIVGSLVDEGIAQGKSLVTGEEERARQGRTPIAPYEDYKTMAKAVDAWVNKGNIQPMRKQFVRWGLGFSGIGGAATLNRLLDGILAAERGYEQTVSGEPAFPIEGTSEKIKAMSLGTYSTDAGKEYIDSGFKKMNKDVSTLKQEIKDKLDSGEFGSVEVAKEYFESEMKKMKNKEKESMLELPKEEFKAELKKSIENGILTVEDAKKLYVKWENQENPTDRTKAYVKERDEKLPMKLGLVLDYGKAFTIDPGNAWKALGPNEKLGIVEGNLVEMQRFKLIDYDKEGGSDEYKRKAMAQLGIPWSESKNYKLEHIVPVKAGGDTSSNNLKIVTNAEHNAYTDWDKAAAKAVQDKRMTRKEVAEIAIKLKMDKTVTVQQAMNMLK